MNKQRGFSLVEVLLALALIGVISVVSIRILSNRDNMLEFTAKRDKVLANMQGIAKERMFNLNVDELDYNELSNALNAFKTNNGGTRDKASFEISEGTGNYIATVKIDVNGSDIFPNETGRDIYTYYVDRYGNFVLDSISEGNMIVAGGTSLWEPQEPTPITKSDITGDEGSVPDDLDLPEDEDIWKTCWDGSKVKDLSLCPEQNTQKDCGNGVFVPMDEDCPAPIVCWDGSVVTDESLCPDKTCDDGTVVKADEDCPEYKTCDDGTVVKADEDCPEYKTCPDGRKVLVTADCPISKKTCPDGTIVAEGEDCPCIAQTCKDGYAFDPATCSCVAGGNGGEGNSEAIDPYNWPISMKPLFYMDKNGFASVNLQSQSYSTGRFGDIYWGDDIEVIRDPSTGTAKRVLRFEEWLQIMGNPKITIQAVAKYDDGTEKVLPEGKYLGEYEGNGHTMLSAQGTFWEIWRDKDPANLMNLDSISIRVFADGKELTNLIGNFNYSGPTWGTCNEWKKGCEYDEQKYNAYFNVIFPNDNDLRYGREDFFDEEDYFKNCADSISKDSYVIYGSFTCTPTKVTKDFFKQ